MAKKQGEAEEIRVLLLGKTGAGKSSLGNTLLGRQAFEVGRGLSSGTEKCQYADTMAGDKLLQVTDTPGLCDTHRPEEEVLREIAKSVAVAEPGPHVVIIVLRCDRRFTTEEHGAYYTLRSLFGKAVCKHIILVFVGVDELTKEQGERQSALKKMIQNNPPSTLEELISDCSGRFFAVDNTSSSEDKRQQAADLLSRIQELIKQNDGQHFRNKLCEDAAKDVAPMIEKRMQEDHVTREDATRAVREDIVEEKVVVGFFNRLITTVTDAIMPVIAKASAELAEKGLAKMKASQCSVM